MEHHSKTSYEIKPGLCDKESVRLLFGEYKSMLESIRADVGEYLRLQNYERELVNLEEKYGLPWGRLYLAYAGDEAIGCIALRRLTDSECEMKRLFVKERFRRCGIAEALAARLIAEAKAAGYQAMLLDSLPELVPALAFYRKLGFYPIEAYNDSPVSGTVFMRLDL